MVKFLHSWLAHALKVTIFPGLLLLSRGQKLSGMKVNAKNFQLIKEIVFMTITSWDIQVWILVMFVGADQFLDIFLDLQLLSSILSRYLPMCTRNWQLNFWNAIRSIVSKRCCAKMLLGHKFLHCAMEWFLCPLRFRMSKTCAVESIL